MTTPEIAHARNDAPAGSQHLPIAMVVPSLTNPRKHFDENLLRELSESIKHVGIAQPILVRRLPAARVQETFTDRRKGDPLPTHEIVAGERRYRAAKMAGLESVPYLERELTDDEVLHLQIVENLLREGLHPLEEADGYRRILDLPSQGEKPMKERIAALAAEIKKSTRYIYTTLQLLQLCDFAREIFTRPNVMPRSIALQIATIGNEPGQIEATKRICGLVQQGKEWVQGDAGLTQREATQYVKDNFRLVLSKAPFPIKVVYAGAVACTECPKNTENAPHLEEEGAKVPATCTDPSCYGKKNAEHARQVADAAKKGGQKVITGKDAKKLAPYEEDPDYIAGDYYALSKRLYGEVDDSHSGKTVKQLLGADIPKPVLIERPDGKGFIEALPKADVHRLIKERGLTRSATRYTKPESQRKAEEKAKLERQWRDDAAHQLLAAVPKQANQDAARSRLLLFIALHLYESLHHETSKRVRSLLQWDIERARPWEKKERAKLEEHFKALDGTQLNQFIVATLIADELGGNTYGTPMDHDLNACAEILGVDLKAVKASIEAAHKEKAKAKSAKKAPANKAPAKTAAKAGRRPDLAFMHPLTPSPELAAITGADPMPRTEIVSKVWAYIKKNKLQDTTNKRMVNCDEKLQAIFGKGPKVSMFEMAGLLGKHASASKPAAAEKKTAAAPAAEGIQPAVGCTVKIKDGLKGPHAIRRKICGRTGTLTKKLTDGEWLFTGKESKDATRVKTADFEVIAAAAPAAAVKPTKTAAKKPAAKKAAGKKDGEIGQGELELDTGTKLKPQPAWPFPTAKNPDPFGKGAQA